MIMANNKSAKTSAKFNSEMFADVPVLQRKWQAAVRPGEKLPHYEDVMLGSLGRLADHIVLLRNVDGVLSISHTGRYVQTWLNDERWDIPLGALPPDCATALTEAAANARENCRPYLASAHCVRDGLVRTFDVLALPTRSRWGGILVGVYVNERNAQYNLLDTIFSATDEGVLSLAAIRDARGEAADFQIVHLNQGAARLLMQPATELLWRRLSAGGNPLAAPAVMNRLREFVGSGPVGQFEIDSGDRCLRLGVTAFGDMLSLTVSDVTALKQRELSFRLLFENNPMPMWVFDAGTMEFLSVNDAAVQHYGYSRERFLGMTLREIWPQDEWAMHSAALREVGDVYQSSRDWRHIKADGTEIHVLTFGRRVAFEGRDGYLVAVVDITERRAAEARIAHMAHHDGLTNLPNRDFYQERLREALERSRSGNKRVAVMCIDLDLFKNVNDSFGHPMGDRLLKLVAERLREVVRDDNVAARLGGDEFAIVLAADVSPNEASAFAERLIDALSAPYKIDGLEVVVGASVGIALSPGDGTTSEELMRNADMALYRAKSEGGGVHHFFEPEMDQQAQKRRDMERDLRAAFSNGEFELHYQPLVDISADRISGFESLLRWQHPQKGMISPAEFIPVAEDIGLIVALGEWVAARSLRRGDEVACRREGRGQSVTGAVPQPQSGPGRDLGAGAFRPVGAPARARDHRVGVFGGDRGQSRDPASAARTRRQHLDGRFRHRLFQPELSAQLPVRQDQDRPLLREGPGAALRLPGDRARDLGPWPQPQDHHDRGRGRDDGPARLASRRRLQRGAGLPVQRGAARARDSGVADWFCGARVEGGVSFACSSWPGLTRPSILFRKK
ncbi:diguanylate cyclase (GGDEF)-like protein/PAS domain S-box-containing protein [Bradyrhizobium sp. USDA 3240]